MRPKLAYDIVQLAIPTQPNYRFQSGTAVAGGFQGLLGSMTLPDCEETFNFQGWLTPSDPYPPVGFLKSGLMPGSCFSVFHLYEAAFREFHQPARTRPLPFSKAATEPNMRRVCLRKE
jgi:hypothetical protein